MKFSAAVFVAVVMASLVHGFVPATISTSTKTNVVLSMSTETPTKTYTFTKSEEVFAEAQTVRSFLIRILVCLVADCASTSSLFVFFAFVLWNRM
jgi:hypothetical protein